MQLLVRFDSLIAIYMDYNKVCKMESDWIKNKAVQPTEIPNQILRKGNIILSDKYCVTAVGYYSISWDSDHLENTQIWNKKHILQISDMIEKRTWYITAEDENLSIRFFLLGTESNRKDSQQKRCLMLMAKANQKEDNRNLVILNHYTSFQNPDHAIIKKEIRIKKTVS